MKTNCVLAEVLYIIFSNDRVDPLNLRQFQLVCKSWSPVARQLLYKNVKIGSRSQFMSFRHCISQDDNSEGPGRLVESFSTICEGKYGAVDFIRVDYIEATCYTKVLLQLETTIY